MLIIQVLLCTHDISLVQNIYREQSENDQESKYLCELFVTYSHHVHGNYHMLNFKITYISKIVHVCAHFSCLVCVYVCMYMSTHAHVLVCMHAWMGTCAYTVLGRKKC